MYDKSFSFCWPDIPDIQLKVLILLKLMINTISLEVLPFRTESSSMDLLKSEIFICQF